MLLFITKNDSKAISSSSNKEKEQSLSSLLENGTLKASTATNRLLTRQQKTVGSGGSQHITLTCTADYPCMFEDT